MKLFTAHFEFEYNKIKEKRVLTQMQRFSKVRFDYSPKKDCFKEFMYRDQNNLTKILFATKVLK